MYGKQPYIRLRCYHRAAYGRGVFDEVVAQLQLLIVEEARQLLPQRERVAARFSCRALGQHVLAHRLPNGER
jgi:hypothetical protein